MYVSRVSIFSGYLQVVLVMTEFMSRDFCPSSDDFNGVHNLTRNSKTERLLFHDQLVYAHNVFRALKKLLCSFLLIPEKSDWKKEK